MKISSTLAKPKFRDAVTFELEDDSVRLSCGTTECAFTFDPQQHGEVSQLLTDLRTDGVDVDRMEDDYRSIGRRLGPLLEEFDRVRLLVDADTSGVVLQSGTQMYRQIRQLCDRLALRTSTSSFHRALTDATATTEQLVGYVLEYRWIVSMAPSLIAPALASAHTPAERRLLEDYLRSEIGHEHYLTTALDAVAFDRDALARHQPLPKTFALGASLGVYARQHPLSFKASLFLFERAQPAFVDAFDARCRQLGLPDAFYEPLRGHADLNSTYNHEDITGDLLELEPLIDVETSTVVKRHVSILLETLIALEDDILAHYGPHRSDVLKEVS